MIKPDAQNTSAREKFLELSVFPGPAGGRAKLRDKIGMWEGMASSNANNFKRNRGTKKITSDWIFGESSSATASHHMVEASLSNSIATSAPTRRLSAASSGSKGGSHRNSVKRLKVRSRFGRPPYILSKAVQSLQVVRDDLAKLASSNLVKPVNTTSTQTIEQDEFSLSTTSMFPTISKRHSRIPIPQDRTKKDKDQKVVSSNAEKVPTELGGSYSQCNVFSVMTISNSYTNLELISSASKLSVCIRPSIEAKESCRISEVNVLAFPEIKRKDVEVDTTLENWKPSLAEVSVVAESKIKQNKKEYKSIVKPDKSKAKEKDGSGKGKGQETIKDNRSSETIPSSEKVTESDKVDRCQASGSAPASRKKSETKTGSRDKNESSSKSRANAETKGSKCEEIQVPGAASGSSCRVRFSPQLTSSYSPAKTGDEKTEKKESSETVSKFPDLLKRVTDQAITSIAKSVMLGLPRQFSKYEPHQTSSMISYRPNSTSLGNSKSFHLSRPSPLTMSSVNTHDEGYPLYARNNSQLSVSSLFNGQYGSSIPVRYGGYRSTTAPLTKTRKELDNRFSQTNIWDSPSRNSWLHDPYANSDFLDDMNYSTGGRKTLTFPSAQNWMKSYSRKGGSGWPASPSSLYIKEATKYSRPSERFSVKGHSGILHMTKSRRFSTMDEQDLTGSSGAPISSYRSGYYTKATRGIKTM